MRASIPGVGRELADNGKSEHWITRFFLQIGQRQESLRNCRIPPMGTKRIALFMPDLGGGGARRMMINLARGIVGQGAEVDMVLIRKEGPYLPLVPSSIRIEDLRAGRTSQSIGVPGEIPVAGAARVCHHQPEGGYKTRR